MTNIYARDVSRIKTLDPYRLQELYKMHPCAEHVVKKLLVAGGRSGGKNMDRDINDCIETLQRWQAMREEDVKGVSATTQYDWSKVDKSINWIFRTDCGDAYGNSEKPLYQKGIGWLRAPGEYFCQLAIFHRRPMLGVDVEGTLERRP